MVKLEILPRAYLEPLISLKLEILPKTSNPMPAWVNQIQNLGGRSLPTTGIPEHGTLMIKFQKEMK